MEADRQTDQISRTLRFDPAWLKENSMNDAGASNNALENDDRGR